MSLTRRRVKRPRDEADMLSARMGCNDMRKNVEERGNEVLSKNTESTIVKEFFHDNDDNDCKNENVVHPWSGKKESDFSVVTSFDVLDTEDTVTEIVDTDDLFKEATTSVVRVKPAPKVKTSVSKYDAASRDVSQEKVKNQRKMKATNY